MNELKQKSIPVRDAVGMVLAHDITEINPRTGFKGRRFSRGHVVAAADVDKLLDLGKERLYVLEVGDGRLHEDEAALLLAAAIAGPGTDYVPEPREGKINITAATDGVLRVEVDSLAEFNMLGEVMCATRHRDTLVAAGDTVAGTRAIPLIVESRLVDEAAGIAGAAGGLVSVAPLKRARAALIITGNEVYHGRIEDAFEPVIRRKLKDLGSEVTSVKFCPDDAGMISAAIGKGAAAGADLIVLTGGMSVDPDDVTLSAVEAAGATVSAYGSSVIPGAMFMAAYLSDGTPVLGVPACGIFHANTILDLVLPRVLAGEIIGRREIARLGHGGLCLGCDECRFPVCPFGKA